ncbi:MAG: HAMP domain-containing histidine kinase, partial [Lachnospiraceae bacterium]|nr:HAMP domain-containing histidine kinase [Lachnospiraceae bacterium]
MKQRSKRKLNLFAKTFLTFALSITIFAVALGVVYLNLYRQATFEDYEKKLRQNAESVASTCADYYNAPMSSRDFTAWNNYWNQCREIMQVDIWPISNPETDENLKIKGLGLDLMEDSSIIEGVSSISIISEGILKQIADNIFAGNGRVVPVKNTYAKEYDNYVMSLGVPVIANGDVVGCIIVASEVELQNEIVNNAQRLIWISSAVALTISLLIAVFFASMLTNPIRKVQQAAVTLASKNYDIPQVTSKRHDEIGELTEAMRFLAAELKAGEIERKNLEQTRLDFFANVSHELKTPITVLMAYTESLKDGMISEAKIPATYEKMIGECESMRRLTNDLLSLSKMQNPDFVIEKEPINLVQIFNDNIIKSCQAIGEKKNVEIVMDMDNDMYMVLGDYGRIRQMFLVILDNAIKFSNENSKVYVN